MRSRLDRSTHLLIVVLTGIGTAVLVAPAIRGWEPPAAWLSLLSGIAIAFITAAGTYAKDRDKNRAEVRAKLEAFITALDEAREAERAADEEDSPAEDERADEARRTFERARTALYLALPPSSDLLEAAKEAARVFGTDAYPAARSHLLAVAHGGKVASPVRPER